MRSVHQNVPYQGNHQLELRGNGHILRVGGSRSASLGIFIVVFYNFSGDHSSLRGREQGVTEGRLPSTAGSISWAREAGMSVMSSCVPEF